MEELAIAYGRQDVAAVMRALLNIGEGVGGSPRCGVCRRHAMEKARQILERWRQGNTSQ